MITSKQHIRLPMHYICVWCLILLGHASIAQQDTLTGTALVDHLLLKEEVAKARKVVFTYIAQYENTPDSLSNMPYYIGKLARLEGTLEKSLRQMEDFVTQMETNGATNKSLYLAKINMSQFYDEVGEVGKSLKVTEEALQHILKAENVTKSDIGKVKYNLGVSYISLDNLPKAKLFFKKALLDYESYPQIDNKKLSDGYNAMGAVMWMSSKLDSAAYYYDKASVIIKDASGDAIENLYYATVIQSNVSLLEHSQGHLSKALEVQNEVIHNYEKVIAEIQSPDVKIKAQRFQARAISNLSTFYNEMGNLTRANELIRYSYAKKKVFLEPTDDDVISTLVQIGQSEISLKSFEDAKSHIQDALVLLKGKVERLPYWEATAYHGMAEIYVGQHKKDSALYFFDKAAPLYEESLGANIDASYLSYLENKSQFEAALKRHETAEKTAIKAYDYVLRNTGEESMILSKQMLNLSEVYLKSDQYKKASLWSYKADSLLQKKKTLASTNADSIKIDFNRPLLILLNTKSRYQQLENVSEQPLLAFVEELEMAVTILERRKTITFTPADIDQLLSEYKQINMFLKQLFFDLYTITGHDKYLSSLMSIHESGVYNRIRAKLNYRNIVTFSNIPITVLEREKKLKKSLSSTLSITETDNVMSFFEAEKKWNTFKDSLKEKYPKYYKMRYATIQAPIEEVVKNISASVSVVRYVFIQEQLYAFVIHNGIQDLIPIDFKGLDLAIANVTSNQFDERKILEDLHLLYSKLWKPIEDKGIHNEVVIIPDGLLFNLSFEMLTTSQVDTYEELANASLLRNHTISYNYSLHTLSTTDSKILTNSFIAFTPEFSKDMKESYRVAIKDSLDMDKAYLTLLPQPFSVDIAKNYNQVFKGDHYLNKKATKQLFVESAGEHKIIHIGTHAESNNVTPELSRLIFAKPIDEDISDENDNSLYMYEIYNCNLSSNLAILTACETGKPTYQAGEGMISLAHAFNYAGSESILTSLWKIDEQSSAIIVGYFYDNLAEGMSKDEALRQAKLTYLETSQGRTLHPSYWAGLALIGNTSPLDLTTSSLSGLWWLCGILIIIAVLFLLKSYTKK
ncbi:hypothetical protein GCM10011344_29960 [Dokdonia pacifica]|uniref:CHAT domain-containing protein n=1 Tax=Dokdonia pacifica TaxID=1627892 RepID=A0A239C222_9FLAO|nr:CHAT domain-containing tetratricopeptide repeat protein [Dokdonia pacifica]GGG27188.1 hypothetical protein GCM10011344_29960 [Dokdonia pacifica]SNS13423.1 CHAT domain-containing protein [Dokdonia pacifica]